jgi:conjugal transfer pilus assembly protein TraE
MLYERWIKEWKSALAENFFLRVLCLILAMGIIANVVFFRKKDRIVIVPPKVEKALWVESDMISESYLEQMGLFFATFSANMSPVNAEYNTKVLSEYTDPAAYATLKNDISAQGAYFKKNNITQAFFPEAVRCDPREKSVSVEGQAIRYIGTVKVGQEKVIMHVKFRLKDYSLKIEELYMDYPERKKKKMEEDEKKRMKEEGKREKNEKREKTEADKE